MAEYLEEEVAGPLDANVAIGERLKAGKSSRFQVEQWGLVYTFLQSMVPGKLAGQSVFNVSSLDIYLVIVRFVILFLNAFISVS